MSVEQRVEPIAEQVVGSLGLRLYDIDFNGGILRVFVDGGDASVTLDELATANRALGVALDDADPIPARYQLEVSSPGLERRLRRPAHWQSAIGATVRVKLLPGVEGDRRIEGVVESVNDESVTIRGDGPATRELRMADISKATTVFDWGSARSNSESANRSKRAPVPADAPSTDTKDESE